MIKNQQKIVHSFTSLVRWVIQCPDRFGSKCGLYNSGDIAACIPEYELITG